MRTPRISKDQLDVLQRLASCDEPLAYSKGGYWSNQNQAQHAQRHGGAPIWHTIKGTVDALERKGLLKQTGSSTNYPIGSYPLLSDRVLSALGLAVATGTDLPAQGLVEAVAAYTGRILHYSAYRVLDDADWAALVERLRCLRGDPRTGVHRSYRTPLRPGRNHRKWIQIQSPVV